MEFSVKNKNLLIQNLVEIQQQSFNELLCVGLKRQLLQLNYIENKTKNLKLIFHAKNYKFVLPDITPKEAILKAKSFASAIFVPVEYRTKKTIGIYWVLLGHLPFMTKRGHFIINGVPRVVLNQMVRSPGLYYKTTANFKNLSNDASGGENSYQEKESSQNVPIFYSDIIPNRGTWLRLEIDRKKNIWVRMKRVDKIPMMLFLQALGYDLHRVEKLLYSRKFLNRDYLLNTDHPVNSNLALKKIKVEIEHQKILKLAALEALNDDDPDITKQLDYIEKTTTPTMGKEFLFQSFFNPASYDLSPIGRFQLNKKLNLSIPNDYTVLTEFDIFFATKELIKKASTMSNSDDIDHLQTRRIRSCGELLEIQLGEGIERLQKIIIDKIGNTHLKRFSKPSKKRTVFNKDEKFKLQGIKKVDKDIKKVNKPNLSKLSNINNITASTQTHTYNCYFSKLPLEICFKKNNFFPGTTNLRFVAAKNKFFKASPILKAIRGCRCTNRRFVQIYFFNTKSKICRKHNFSLKKTSSYMDFLRTCLLKVYETRFTGYKLLIRNCSFTNRRWRSLPFLIALQIEDLSDKNILKDLQAQFLLRICRPISKQLLLPNNKLANQFSSNTDKRIKLTSFDTNVSYVNLGGCTNLISKSDFLKSNKKQHIIKQKTTYNKTKKRNQNFLVFEQNQNKVHISHLNKIFKLLFNKSPSFKSSYNKNGIISNLKLVKNNKKLSNTKVLTGNKTKFLNHKRFLNFNNLISFYKFINMVLMRNLSQTNLKCNSQIDPINQKFTKGKERQNIIIRPSTEKKTIFLSKVSKFNFLNIAPLQPCKSKICPNLFFCYQYNFDKKRKLQKNRSKKIIFKNRPHFSLNKFLKITDTSIQNLITTNSINGALQELFGLNPLSQFMDQINPLSEITHKRRVSSMGPGGVNRDNASMEVRSIHPTHYGRICPIETPEGHNAGLVNSPTLYARINNYGFLETPFFKVNSGQVQTKALYLTAQKEQQFKVSPPDLSCSELSFLPLGPTKMEGEVPMRKDFKFQRMVATQIEFIGVSPLQMISVATSLIPFLEHDDANRALMGSNMQRQAVPLLTAERPIVGTGLEGRVIADSSYIMQTKASGIISYVSNEVITVQTFN